MSALILNIDTATPDASICLADGDIPLGMIKNATQQEHAGWLHEAIDQLLRQCGRNLSALDAVAVTAGPGSYTGLRVSMATAKGFCYTLGKPLLVESTLKVMACSAIMQISTPNESLLYCPMIDARRMEVFTALYDGSLNELLSPSAAILDANFHTQFPSGQDILVFGNGSKKYQQLEPGELVRFETIETHAGHLARLSAVKYAKREFSPVSTTVPFYGKAFYTPPVK